MRGLPHQLGLRNLEALGDAVEPGVLRLRECRLSIGPVAIRPFHVANFLPRGFDQIAEKNLFVFGEIHRRTKEGAAGEVKLGAATANESVL